MYENFQEDNNCKSKNKKPKLEANEDDDKSLLNLTDRPSIPFRGPRFSYL